MLENISIDTLKKGAKILDLILFMCIGLAINGALMLIKIRGEFALAITLFAILPLYKKFGGWIERFIPSSNENSRSRSSSTSSNSSEFELPEPSVMPVSLNNQGYTEMKENNNSYVPPTININTLNTFDQFETQHSPSNSLFYSTTDKLPTGQVRSI